MRRALVLFSGGLDSSTVLAIARDGGFEPLALLFDYGQRHGIELACAREQLDALGVDARVVPLDLRAVGGSALTSDSIAVPRGRSDEELGAGVPPTYVPARNTVFLAHALAWAEVEAIDDIFIGINAVDYSGYPDCRPAYLEAFRRLANLASRRTTEEGRELSIHAPLLHLTKGEIIRRGLALGVDYAKTWSCYAPRSAAGADGRLACGACDSCRLRLRGFREAGVADPIAYETGLATECAEGSVRLDGAERASARGALSDG